MWGFRETNEAMFLAPSDCDCHTLGATVIDTKDKIQDYMQNLVEIIDYYGRKGYWYDNRYS